MIKLNSAVDVMEKSKLRAIVIIVKYAMNGVILTLISILKNIFWSQFLQNNESRKSAYYSTWFFFGDILSLLLPLFVRNIVILSD